MRHPRRAGRYQQSELSQLNKPEILTNFTTSALAGAVTVIALSTPPLQMSRKIEVIIYYFKYSPTIQIFWEKFLRHGYVRQTVCVNNSLGPKNYSKIKHTA